MPVGRMKWFNDSQGYGFIEQENGEDVFIHFPATQDEGFKTLKKEDQQVEFEAVPGPKCFQASKVMKLPRIPVGTYSHRPGF